MALVLRPENHPNYSGKRKPKVAAAKDPDTWELHRILHPELYEEAEGDSVLKRQHINPSLADYDHAEEMFLETDEITGENK